jgi:hypothetical protein
LMVSDAVEFQFADPFFGHQSLIAVQAGCNHQGGDADQDDEQSEQPMYDAPDQATAPNTTDGVDQEEESDEPR